MTDVLTLRLESGAQSFFEEQRQRYFPPERNLIPAHLTLFHTLPQTTEISEKLAEIASAVETFRLRVTGLRSLGRGVAYVLAAPPLIEVHSRLAESFTDFLTPQDRQKFQPHIVVQNKVLPDEAKRLLALLQERFVPFEVEAEGFYLWHYLNGPWELADSFKFAGHVKSD